MGDLVVVKGSGKGGRRMLAKRQGGSEGSWVGFGAKNVFDYKMMMEKRQIEFFESFEDLFP